MVVCTIKCGSFPDRVCNAHICLVCSLLSLLNCDQKITANVLTNRLNNHVGSLIHPNQAGFIPKRFTFSNTRQLLTIVYGSHLQNAAVISLDAQITFDQIECN